MRERTTMTAGKHVHPQYAEQPDTARVEVRVIHINYDNEPIVIISEKDWASLTSALDNLPNVDITNVEVG